jgi:hypothetical protein
MAKVVCVVVISAGPGRLVTLKTLLQNSTAERAQHLLKLEKPLMSLHGNSGKFLTSLLVLMRTAKTSWKICPHQSLINYLSGADNSAHPAWSRSQPPTLLRWGQREGRVRRLGLIQLWQEDVSLAYCFAAGLIRLCGPFCTLECDADLWEGELDWTSVKRRGLCRAIFFLWTRSYGVLRDETVDGMVDRTALLLKMVGLIPRQEAACEGGEVLRRCRRGIG